MFIEYLKGEIQNLIDESDDEGYKTNLKMLLSNENKLTIIQEYSWPVINEIIDEVTYQE